MRDRISPALERSAGDRRARSSNGGNRCLDGARPWRIGLNGGNWQLVEEVVEVESGKSHRNRPGLARALEACRRYGAKLIISRLDRLSRDPVFLLSLPRPDTAGFHDRAAATSAGLRGGAAARLSAAKFAELVRPLLEDDLAGRSANATAQELNRRGVQTPRGGSCTARSVLNLKARISSPL